MTMPLSTQHPAFHYRVTALTNCTNLRYSIPCLIITVAARPSRKEHVARPMDGDAFGGIDRDAYLPVGDSASWNVWKSGQLTGFRDFAKEGVEGNGGGPDPSQRITIAQHRPVTHHVHSKPRCEK